MKSIIVRKPADNVDGRQDGWLWALRGVLSAPNPSPGLLRLALITAVTVVSLAALAAAVLIVRPEVLTAFASSAATR
ncbi:hypothetical protein [Amycolatopsis lexingtonensis]|uniref:hypothetical protein n=1 Tax=Amycolatopsis lexingtonensis TaxID=218822 RepID=UPI003F6F0ADC